MDVRITAGRHLIYALSAAVVIVLCGWAPSAAQCPSCGNGIVGVGEECDDGNTEPGDGCDATCQLEVPAGCVEITEGDYETAFGADPLFQTTRARASGLGYQTTLTTPVQCTAADGVTPIYTAVLLNPSDHSDALIIRSRADLPEPFTTVLYRNVSSTEKQIVYADGAVRFTTDPQFEDPQVAILDGLGQEVGSSLFSTGVHLPSCSEVDKDFDRCLWANLISDPLRPVVCALELFTCAPGTWAFLACVGAFEALPSGGCLILLANLLDAPFSCTHPLGADCSTVDCKAGLCALVGDEMGNAFWQCQGGSGTPLCDAGLCEGCSEGRCETTCGRCELCDAGGTCVDITPPPTEEKWAKVTQLDTDPADCTCAFGFCACGASASITVSYFGCADIPALPPDAGECGFGSIGSIGGLLSCPPRPRICDPQFHSEQAWNSFNACEQCDDPGEVNNCSLPEPVRGPLRLGDIEDLRTDDEKLAKCCEVQP